jgi:hypothetical protein
MLNVSDSINKDTIISSGMGLSRNVILGHVSNGAYHYVLGRIIPQFTAFLKPGSSTIPDWKVAKNLSMGSENILENLMDGFGQDLILRSGFSGALGSAQNLGQMFDIQIDGFQNNMFGVSKEIQKLTKSASSLQMVFGNSSFMRVGFDEKSIKNNLISGAAPVMETFDAINNIKENGLTSLRGFGLNF